jgi:hypothetical protein
MSGVVRIYEQGTSTSPGDEITNQPFDVFANDWHDIELDEPVSILVMKIFGCLLR